MAPVSPGRASRDGWRLRHRVVLGPAHRRFSPWYRQVSGERDDAVAILRPLEWLLGSALKRSATSPRGVAPSPLRHPICRSVARHMLAPRRNGVEPRVTHAVIAGRPAAKAVETMGPATLRGTRVPDSERDCTPGPERVTEAVASLVRSPWVPAAAVILRGSRGVRSERATMRGLESPTIPVPIVGQRGATFGVLPRPSLPHGTRVPGSTILKHHHVSQAGPDALQDLCIRRGPLHELGLFHFGPKAVRIVP